MVDKKILILYGSAGHGHEKAAKAVEAASLSNPSVRCVDVLKHTSFGFGRNYRGAYLFMIRNVPWLWGFFYYALDFKLVYALARPIRRWVNRAFAYGVEKLIREADPDVIVSTHFLGSEVASHLKKQNLTRARLVTVVTDYLVHAIWITPETDLYCVACEETAQDLEQRGVPREKIRVTGIPIEPKFSKPLDREALRKSFGIERGQFTALVTSGGGGVGLLEPLLDRLAFLEPRVQALAVCGTNEAMRLRLSRKYRDRPNLRIFGFVNNIHELMAASDILVGKGGGLTITESLAMSKPMVLIGAVPGQETKNVRVMLKAGAASRARSIAEAAALVQKHQKDGAFYQQKLASIVRIRKNDAAQAVMKAALEGA